MVRWLNKARTPAPERIAVLCYHGYNVMGPAYHENDHVALDVDLATARSLGFKAIPISSLKSYLDSDWRGPDVPVFVVTMDDGTDYDYFDLEHPRVGLLESMRSILHRHNVPATAFVIASPQARKDIDSACLAGRGQIGDKWWDACQTPHENNGITIANHSWDHNHEAVKERVITGSGGDFFAVQSIEDARAEIVQAERFISKRTNGNNERVFAYPYGHIPEVVAGTFLPGYQAEHGLWAAFGTGGEYLTRETNRWRIPRFVCGEHWKSAGEFEAILKGAE